MQIELATSPDEGDLRTISRGIESYNEEHLPHDVVYEKDTKFAVFARDAGGNVVGGVRATAFWNYCIIELLWLSFYERIGYTVFGELSDYPNGHTTYCLVKKL